MARLRQLNTNNYRQSNQIDAEFASVIRYLNAAEIGNKTLAELLVQLFDGDGTVDGIVEMRLDPSAGLQFRSGNQPSPETGWRTLAQLAELRGAPGISFGVIGEPVITSRADYTANAGQVDFAYVHESGDDLLVYRNGLLLRAGSLFDYTSNAAADTVTLNAPASAGDRLSVYRVRNAAANGFSRLDNLLPAPQSIFTLPALTPTASVQVYRNGILQREGSGADYVLSLSAGTVNFSSPVPSDNLVSLVIIDNGASRPVAGLMTEGVYTDQSTGLIRWSRVSVPDAAIAMAKVQGLTTLNGEAARLYVQASSPPTPPAGQRAFWFNTATTPNELFLHDGSAWVRTAPASAVPGFAPTDANRYLRVNGTGTGLVFAPIDLSSAIPVTAIGAASGVASLDSQGRLNPSQLPERVATESLFLRLPGAVANGVTTIKRIWRQRLRIEGVVVATTSGTCTVAIQVNGVPQGSTFVASSTQLEQVLGSPIEVDATASPRTISVEVSGAASPQNLEVILACSVRSE